MEPDSTENESVGSAPATPEELIAEAIAQVKGLRGEVETTDKSRVKLRNWVIAGAVVFALLLASVAFVVRDNRRGQHKQAAQQEQISHLLDQVSAQQQALTDQAKIADLDRCKSTAQGRQNLQEAFAILVTAILGDNPSADAIAKADAFNTNLASKFPIPNCDDLSTGAAGG